MKGRTLRLPDGELEVMRLVWLCTPPVSRQDIEKAAGDAEMPAPTTVLTFLSRLADKGFLSVEKRGRSNLYTPLVSQKEYLAGESRSILDRLYGGSVSAFAAALCDSGVSREEIELLRDALEKGTL